MATVSAVWVYQARYRIPLTKAPAGNWVLLEGVDATITKTATVRAATLLGFFPLHRTEIRARRHPLAGADMA